MSRRTKKTDVAEATDTGVVDDRRAKQADTERARKRAAARLVVGHKGFPDSSRLDFVVFDAILRATVKEMDRTKVAALRQALNAEGGRESRKLAAAKGVRKAWGRVICETIRAIVNEAGKSYYGQAPGVSVILDIVLHATSSQTVDNEPLYAAIIRPLKLRALIGLSGEVEAAEAEGALMADPDCADIFALAD